MTVFEALEGPSNLMAARPGPDLAAHDVLGLGVAVRSEVRTRSGRDEAGRSVEGLEVSHAALTWVRDRTTAR